MNSDTGMVNVTDLTSNNPGVKELDISVDEAKDNKKLSFYELKMIFKKVGFF